MSQEITLALIKGGVIILCTLLVVYGVVRVWDTHTKGLLQGTKALQDALAVAIGDPAPRGPQAARPIRREITNGTPRVAVPVAADAE